MVTFIFFTKFWEKRMWYIYLLNYFVYQEIHVSSNQSHFYILMVLCLLSYVLNGDIEILIYLQFICFSLFPGHLPWIHYKYIFLKIPVKTNTYLVYMWGRGKEKDGWVREKAILRNLLLLTYFNYTLWNL